MVSFFKRALLVMPFLVMTGGSHADNWDGFVGYSYYTKYSGIVWPYYNDIGFQVYAPVPGTQNCGGVSIVGWMDNASIYDSYDLTIPEISNGQTAFTDVYDWTSYRRSSREVICVAGTYYIYDEWVANNESP